MPFKVLGIDPGLVDSGAVQLTFVEEAKALYIWYETFRYPVLPDISSHNHYIFIEDYTPRSHFENDPKMQQLVRDIKQKTGGKVIRNQGVKKVITPQVLKAFQCDRFTGGSNHSDLQSAARIGLLGAARTDEGNRLIFNYLSDYVQGKPWAVAKT